VSAQENRKDQKYDCVYIYSNFKICNTSFTSRVFENRVLRRILEPKRNEVIREWRRLHNKELYALLLTKYHSGD
jgi:hypothetical protein